MNDKTRAYNAGQPHPDAEKGPRVVGEGPLMDFSRALDRIKQGYRMQRDGWNGHGMFVYIVPPVSGGVAIGPTAWMYDLPEGAEIVAEAHIVMRTAKGTLIPWLASQADLLANDWRVFRQDGRPFAPLPTALH